MVTKLPMFKNQALNSLEKNNLDMHLIIKFSLEYNKDKWDETLLLALLHNRFLNLFKGDLSFFFKDLELDGADSYQESQRDLQKYIAEQIQQHIEEQTQHNIDVQIQNDDDLARMMHVKEQIDQRIKEQDTCMALFKKNDDLAKMSQDASKIPEILVRHSFSKDDLFFLKESAQEIKTWCLLLKEKEKPNEFKQSKKLIDYSNSLLKTLVRIKSVLQDK
jgi:hypothetical protein